MIIITVTVVMAVLLIAAIIIITILIAIRKKKQSKVALPTLGPNYDDPYYPSVLDKTASTEISLQTRPETSKNLAIPNQPQENVTVEQQENVAYGALTNQQQQLPGDHAEGRC